MKKDMPLNVVDNVSIAVVLESESPESKNWSVYLINEKNSTLKNVLVTSKGYGLKDDKEVKTTTLRHFIGDLDPQASTKIEAIASEVFGLTNEYWLSYYIDNTIYDKKYIFLPESIVDENISKIPLVNKPGVLIGGDN